MTVFLDASDVIAAAQEFLGHEPQVRDFGLVESAVARPRTTVFGADAYGSLEARGAALMHSLIANHALVDGNKRIGVVGLILFLAFNGRRFTMSDDDLFDLTMSIAAGELSDVDAIAARLGPHVV